MTWINVDQKADGAKRLWIDYQIRCLLHDSRCLSEELDALWPYIVERAAHEGAGVVSIGSTECFGTSLNQTFTRLADGGWTEGPFWTPPVTDASPPLGPA